ncbi:MAG TPA: 5-methyltetrahydropteroyltriglutamate--homocysteine S-methyltransferase [Candidatus Lustribacter sp.]|jgi:5-methyltetrahydropteroyltriglutamate--homocysteine methyltransferase|nr:5-methyltetrahydropteroyltriglutamate--homocysteine S-methyltransferase [Candidatus Lustribacter sp.]
MSAAVAVAKPFFRADHVGSLLRPPEVIAARAALERGAIDAGRLREIEDAAIRDAVAGQERVGLEVVTDGEFRRENWYADFIGRLGGVEIRAAEANPAFAHDAGNTVHYVPKSVVTVAPLRRPEPIAVRDFAFLAGTTTRTAKITLPSPSRLHFHGGRRVVSSTVYPEIEAFFADVVRAYRAEIADLEAAGCRYIQIDDPLFSYFISDRMRAEIVADGDVPEERLERYVRLINDCIAARRAETAIGIHVCRGNARSAWIAEGGYERIAERLFGGLLCDHFLLEYDDDRSGDFEPLRFMPAGKRVVLGLVTSKRGTLEDPETLVRRVDEATKYIALGDLAISPQCGFASIVEGNIITPDDQWAKLRLVVETSRRIWESS